MMITNPIYNDKNDDDCDDDYDDDGDDDHYHDDAILQFHASHSRFQRL